jgi:hypothetical protein
MVFFCSLTELSRFFNGGFFATALLPICEKKVCLIPASPVPGDWQLLLLSISPNNAQAGRQASSWIVREGSKRGGLPHLLFSQLGSSIAPMESTVVLG